MLVADEAVRVDQVAGRPVAIVVGVPGGAVVVEDDGIADACLFDGILDAGRVLLELELRPSARSLACGVHDRTNKRARPARQSRTGASRSTRANPSAQTIYADELRESGALPVHAGSARKSAATDSSEQTSLLG